MKWLPILELATAWLLFLISFFLPATNILSSAGHNWLTGWEASIQSFGGAMNPIFWFAEPRILIYAIFPFTNLLMLIAPKLAIDSPETSSRLALVLVACAIIPWLLPKLITGDFLVGFYCWNASYFLMALGCRTISWFYIVGSEK